MAVPVTQRDDPAFSSLGLVQAAVLGLTDTNYNQTTDIQFIPNMDGFPNGRRLEDDVTRIELQAVGGIVLAAIGLWYDDYIPGTTSSPVTPQLLNVLTYTTGVERNDTAFRTRFPFVQRPWEGTHICNCADDQQMGEKQSIGSFPSAKKLRLATPEVIANVAPNPLASNNTLKYKVNAPAQIKIIMYDGAGRVVKLLADKRQDAGTYTLNWSAASLTAGKYYISISKNGFVSKTLSLVKAK